MKSNKASSVERLQEIARFDAIKAKLLSKPFAQHLKKPLTYWAVSADKRLPLVLMGCTLGEILNMPFDEISSTPGVGQKKICALVRLLIRAAATDPADLPKDGDILRNGAPLDNHSGANRSAAFSGDGAAGSGTAALTDFSAASVSEVMWERWRASVVKHGFDKEMLGRFAPRLRDVTKVIWTTPMDAYTGYTLAQMRKLKTHGEKRVRAILEIFHAVHAMVAGIGAQEHLAVRIVPRRIDKVEHWVAQILQSPGLPDEKAVFDNFTGPLLEQIHDDANEQIAELADVRLGVSRDGGLVNGAGRAMSSVRQIARDMSVTRARVYQLLNEINEILVVRWPTGRHQVYELRNRLLGDADNTAIARDMLQFEAAVELFYPGARRGANGPMNQASMDDNDDDEIEPDSVSFRARAVGSNLAELSV